MADQLYCIRHSLAHMLAQAVQRILDPHVQLGTGPATEDGFYYDMKFSEGVTFKEEELKELGKAVEKCVKEGQAFGHYQCKNYDEAVAIATIMKQEFKKELLKKFHDAGETTYTFYYNTISAAAKDKLLAGVRPDYLSYYDEINKGLAQYDTTLASSGQYIVFIDLCEGGHVNNTKEIPDGCFAPNKIAGAYRQGKEGNPMMTRIYGRAFETKDNLKSHLTMLEEAKKRDHRVIGQKLQLFAFDEEVGPGLPLRLPNGSILVEELEALAKQKEAEYEYTRVRSPHITKESLYIKSGHLPYYAEDMFPPMDMDGDKYYLKPMNCPHHHKIYAATPHSYRDLPLRFAEYGHCYRYEDSGSLFGLMRVRSLCMNDAHIYCTPEQFESEFMKVIELYLFYFNLFGIEKYQMRLSKHSKEGLGKKYVDNEALWIQTEEQVRNVLIKSRVPFFEAENEAAFYGPKIDVQIRSVIGREFTLATNQLDFAVPARFGLTYKDANGKEQTPLCIHRAPLSTHERFIGFLIEHFAGDFPLWLTPEQIRIVPVADAFSDYAHIIQKQMQAAGLRAKVDDSDDSFSKKVRNAEVEKAYYVAIVGEKEVNDKAVSIRNVRTKEQYTINVHEFIKQALEIYTSRRLP